MINTLKNWFLGLSIRWKLQLSFFAVTMVTTLYNRWIASGELLGMMLLSWANIAYYQELTGGMRTAIAHGRFEAFAAETRAGWQQGDIAPA